MSIFGLMTKKEVEKAIAAVQYPSWLLQTAEAQQYSIPDPSVYGNQADLYRRLSWVLAAVTHVASEAALVDFNVEKMVGEDMKDIPNHPFEMLMRKPNPLDSRYEFLYGTVAMKKLTGNVYWWLNKSTEKSAPDEMWLIPSSMIKPVPDANMYIKGYLYYPGNGREIMLDPWEICHFRSFNPFNRFIGLSAIESLAIVAVGDLGMQQYNTKLFKDNNGALPGIITFAEMIGDEQWKKIKDDSREAARNRALMMLRGVGQGGVNWMQNGVSQKDMEFINGRVSNKEEIWTVLAPGLASMLDTSATEANAIAGRATFRERAVYPEMVTMSEKITSTILPSYGDNLHGSFEDNRYVDRAQELLEMTEYSKTHTLEEIRKKYYSDAALGDERDNLLPIQITSETGKVVEPAPIVEPIVEVAEPEAENLEEMQPDQIKAIVELDKWDAKSVKAGKLTVWHNLNIPNEIYKAVKDGLSFDDAREQVKNREAKPDYSVLLDAMRLEVDAVQKSQAPQPLNVTVHNHPGEAPVVNVEAAKASIIPAPVVNITNNVEPAPVSVKAPDVVVHNDIKSDKPDETKDVVKAIRKLAHGK